MTWNVLPIQTVIMMILRRRRGVIIDDDMNRLIEAEIDRVPNEQEVNNALMKLEVCGLIHVSQITKLKRRIEMIDENRAFLAIDED